MLIPQFLAPFWLQWFWLFFLLVFATGEEGCWIDELQIEEAIACTTKCSTLPYLLKICWVKASNLAPRINDVTHFQIFFPPNHPEDTCKYVSVMDYDGIWRKSIQLPWSFLASFPAPYLKNRSLSDACRNHFTERELFLSWNISMFYSSNYIDEPNIFQWAISSGD